MIWCVTWNPSLDVTYVLERPLKSGEIFRSYQELYRAGGKGNNVARALRVLGTWPTSVGFYGGPHGDYIQSLLRDNAIDILSEKIPGDNRMCLTILDSSQHVTELRGVGPFVTMANQESLLSRLVSAIDAQDWVVLSGSLPPGLQPEVVGTWINRLAGHTRGIIVDMAGPTLQYAWCPQVYGICPNHDEYHDLLSQRLSNQGPLNVFVTQGSHGIKWKRAGKQDIEVKVPPTDSINPVGAGDVFVAGLVSILAQGGTVIEAVLTGAAAATASITSLGVADFSPSMFESTLDRIRRENTHLN